MGGTHIVELCRELSPVEETPLQEQGTSVRSPPPEKDELIDTIRDGLTANCIPNPPYTTQGRRR